MWKNWITIAWRNFLKYKSFSVINITGLSLGIASMLAITLYVFDELQYDRFHSNADRIFQINVTTSYDGSDTRYATTSTPLAEAIASDVQEVEKVGRLFQRQATIQVVEGDGVEASDKKYREDNFYFGDPSILDILTFQFISGNATKALKNPNQIIISETVARKYFGATERAIGKQLMFEGSVALEVSAVIKDLPDQASHQIGLLTHFDNYYTSEAPEVREFLKHDWLYNPLSTYVLLKDRDQLLTATEKIQNLNAKYADERVREHVKYELQPLTSLHLYSNFSYASDRNTIRYVYIFSFIGVLILLIACINFVNLSTVHSMKRAKEIGIRKVVGAVKASLTAQFLTESLVMVFLSLILSFIIVYSLLPGINILTGKELTDTDLVSVEILSILFIIFLVTGLSAGLYPALHISRFNPVAALKGIQTTGKGYLMRTTLVVIQFTASIVLIVFTVVITRQIDFMQDQPLGFQKDFMLTIPLFSNNPNSILGGGISPELRGRMNSFENEVSKDLSVEAVTVSSVLPGQGVVNALVTTGKIKETDNLFLPSISVDYDFLDSYKMNVMEGRGFNREAGTDHLQAFVINEAAVKELGFTNAEKAIGQKLTALGKEGNVIGVIRNYHFEGLQQPLRPLLLEVNVSKFTTFTVRLNSADVSRSINHIQEQWNAIFPEKVFEYHFLDDQLQQIYAREQRFGSLINFFSSLAIFISSLGLFGLAAYIGHQKRKEAGIRKVLGATTLQVFNALSKEFVKVMALSFLLAIPLGYVLSKQWLGDFAYRIDVGLIPFIVSFAITLAVVFISTAYQTFKTASLNPVNTISNE